MELGEAAASESEAQRREAAAVVTRATQTPTSATAGHAHEHDAPPARALTMVLHHELLLALAGHVGGEVFVERDGTFVIAAGLPLLDESERVAVNDLLALGALYRALAAFVDRHLCGVLATDASGLYVRAMCRGIDAELDAYRHMLVVIEDACKSAAAAGLAARSAASARTSRAATTTPAPVAEASAGLSMTRMQHELSVYRTTVPALHRLATTVDEEGLHGARLLEMVHDACGGR
ncbi:Spc98 family-domain-containing protein [Pavlovales sp. CCMP2436]|nr:Spc98 family-domain-containing protein [Pavlovales sp. CCMP2436]